MLLENRRRGGRLGHQYPDVPDLGPRPGGDDHSQAGPLDHGGSSEDHVDPVRQRRGPLVKEPGRLRHGHALPGEGRLVDRKAADFDDPRIGGHLLAGREHHDVARDDRARRQEDVPAVTADRRLDDGRVLQGGEDPLDTALGDVADDGVRRDHSQDHNRVHEGAARDREHRGASEEEDGQRAEVPGDDRQRRLRLRLGEPVGAELGQTGGRLLRGEARGQARPQPLHQLPRRQLVPSYLALRTALDDTASSVPGVTDHFGDQAAHVQARGVEQDEHAARHDVHANPMYRWVARDAVFELGRESTESLDVFEAQTGAAGHDDGDGNHSGAPGRCPG